MWLSSEHADSPFKKDVVHQIPKTNLRRVINLRALQYLSPYFAEISQKLQLTIEQVQFRQRFIKLLECIAKK